jgi:hypothetical protein
LPKNLIRYAARNGCGLIDAASSIRLAHIGPFRTLEEKAADSPAPEENPRRGERYSEKAPEAVLPTVIAGLTSPLAADGSVLQTQSDRIVTFSHSYRRWYIWLCVVISFPLGLAFLLLDKETAIIAVSLEPTEDGTLLTMSSKGEPVAREAFSQLQV